MNYPSRPNFNAPNGQKRTEMFGAFNYKPIGNGNIRILGAWEAQNIVTVAIPQLAGVEGCNPQGRIRFHRKAVEQLQGFFEAVEKAGHKNKILTWAGSFVARFIRGSTTSLSNHAYGSAFDINAAWNGLGRQPAPQGATGSVFDIVPIAHEFGFYWGGHFSRLDGMHFEVAKLNTFPRSYSFLSSTANTNDFENEFEPSVQSDPLKPAVVQPKPNPKETPIIPQTAQTTLGESTPATEVGKDQVPTDSPVEIKETSILTTLDQYGQKATEITTKAQSVSDSVSNVSRSSLVMTILTKLGGWSLMAWGLFQENWIEILVATVIIVAIIYYFKTSKDRANERTITALKQ